MARPILSRLPSARRYGSGPAAGAPCRTDRDSRTDAGAPGGGLLDLPGSMADGTAVPEPERLLFWVDLYWRRTRRRAGAHGLHHGGRATSGFSRRRARATPAEVHLPRRAALPTGRAHAKRLIGRSLPGVMRGHGLRSDGAAYARPAKIGPTLDTAHKAPVGEQSGPCAASGPCRSNCRCPTI